MEGMVVGETAGAAETMSQENIDQKIMENVQKYLQAFIGTGLP